MKIRSVRANNRKRAFELVAANKRLSFPYSKTEPVPTQENPVVRVFPDDEAAREAFTYALQSGQTGTVHVEQVLEYHRDPNYLRDLLLYRLTLEAQSGASMPASCPSVRSSGGSVPPPRSFTDSWINRIIGSPWTNCCRCCRSSIATSIWSSAERPRDENRVCSPCASADRGSRCSPRTLSGDVMRL